jgi:aminoglycoside phosphotransferase (APT) family kinase protein
VREDLILRIYPGDDASHKSACEFDVMERLYAAGYPVPRVRVLDREGRYLGRPFVVMERIVGRSLGAIVAEAPGAARREPIERFCRVFVDLHALDWRRFVPQPASYEMEPSALFARLLSEWRAHVRALQVDAYDPVFDWLDERLPDVGFGPPSLLHGDYHHYNVLVREADGAAFVIDWGAAMVADYRIDLSWTLLLMSGYGWPEARALVLDGYERAAGRRVPQIEYFLVVASARRLFDITATLTVGAARMGLRPEAEAMVGNAAHIEYVYALLQEQTGMTIPKVERLLSSLQ